MPQLIAPAVIYNRSAEVFAKLHIAVVDNHTEGTAFGHDMLPATCTTAKTCSICGTTEGNANGHNWINATCVTPKTCTVCGATEGEALGHTWTQATCTTAKTCTVCGTTDGTHMGHTWSSGIVTKEPTTEEFGIKLYTCIVCGEEKTESIPMRTEVSGDIDGDKQITYSDAVYLLMYSYFPDDYPVSQECDINGDGEINYSDAVHLLMYTFFPEEYPLRNEIEYAILPQKKREDE